jgi:drug/metabolite transporter (DMT)-like permease
LCTMLGVVLVARGEETKSDADPRETARGNQGVGLALLSATGFGVLFYLLGHQIVPRLGAPQTVWMIRLTCTVLVGIVLLVTKQAMGLPRGNINWIVWSMGLLDTSAFVFSNRGMQLEQVAVVSVLGSLYGAVTVGLAAAMLREHVAKWQWAGIVTIFAGIILISV